MRGGEERDLANVDVINKLGARIKPVEFDAVVSPLQYTQSHTFCKQARTNTKAVAETPLGLPVAPRESGE